MPTDDTLNQLVINTLTQAQYDAIEEPSDDELWLVDDIGGVVNTLNEYSTDVDYPSAKYVYDLLKDVIYPVGSIYLTTQDTCPLSAVFGTWEIVASDMVLQGAGTRVNAGETVEAGLPTFSGTVTSARGNSNTTATGCFTYTDDGTTQDGGDGGDGELIKGGTISFNASDENSVYGKSDTVQPPAYGVNIFKRTA